LLFALLQLRSRAGIKAVSLSLAVLTVTAAAQTAIYVLVLSVALLADLIHNFGDALTAIPLGLAFLFRSARGERWAGLAVVLTIFVSAVLALVQTILRFIHPHTLTHLWRRTFSPKRKRCSAKPPFFSPIRRSSTSVPRRLRTGIGR
jgi:divalent metal cation (Fe/Co/Zn/Cd) transporter